MISKVLFLFLNLTIASADCINTARSVLHGVARDRRGHILRYVPYNGHGLIVDSNILIAAAAGANGSESHSGWSSRINSIRKSYLKHGEDFHLWVTDQTVKEVAIGPRHLVVGGKQIDAGLPEKTRRLPISVSRESEEYKSILNELTELKIGTNKGQNGSMDQNIVADVLFSQQSRSVTPAFATADRGIIMPLCRKNPECSKALGRGSLFHEFRDGFDVNFRDSSGQTRSIRIIPFEGLKTPQK